jgi:hypothetical protein
MVLLGLTLAIVPPHLGLFSGHYVTEFGTVKATPHSPGVDTHDVMTRSLPAIKSFRQHARTSR